MAAHEDDLEASVFPLWDYVKSTHLQSTFKPSFIYPAHHLNFLFVKTYRA